MKPIKRYINIVALLTTIFVGLSGSKRYLFRENIWQSDLSFPFELREIKSQTPLEWHATIVLPPEHYNKKNLDALFLWYSKKHPNREEPLSIAIYTDAENLRRYIQNPDDDVSLHSDTQKDQTSSSRPRAIPWDAIGWRQGEGLGASGGDNLWYSYISDLNDPKSKKYVVLRGRCCLSQMKIIESWETPAANANFKVSIAVYNLIDVEPTGTYYSFSSSTKAEDFKDMYMILTIHRDNVINLPRENIRLINNQIGYIFLGWIYGVTTDGGKTWRLWNAEKYLPDWQCCDPELIRDVDVLPNGTGTMSLHLKTGAVTTLSTKDFGIHWDPN